MKPTPFSAFLALLCLALAPHLSHAQESTRSVEEIYDFDSHGDATITQKYQFNAAQWQAWKETVGNNPDIMLRNMRHMLAKAEVGDFSMERDDLNRKVVGHFKAKCVARYHSGGEFRIDITKDYHVMHGEGLEWVFSATGVMNREIITDTQIGHLPKGARDVRLLPAGDVQQLVYNLDQPDGRDPMLLYGGAGTLGAGVLLLLGGMLVKARKPAPLPPPAPAV